MIQQELVFLSLTPPGQEKAISWLDDRCSWGQAAGLWTCKGHLRFLWGPSEWEEAFTFCQKLSINSPAADRVSAKQGVPRTSDTPLMWPYSAFSHPPPPHSTDHPLGFPSSDTVCWPWKVPPQDEICHRGGKFSQGEVEEFDIQARVVADAGVLGNNSMLHAVGDLADPWLCQLHRVL